MEIRLRDGFHLLLYGQKLLAFESSLKTIALTDTCFEMRKWFRALA